MYKIGELLGNEKNFIKDYFILRIPAIHSLNGKWKAIIRKILSYADVFIYQRVSIENKFSYVLGTDYIKTALSKEGCTNILIPNMYFTGYWPQFENQRKIYMEKGHQVMAYGDKNIQLFIDNCENTDLIKQHILNTDFYTKDEILDNAKESILELGKREKECSINISQYINENWTKIKLFYTPNHPTMDLYFEMIKRIENKLNIQFNSIVSNILPQDGTELIIYPCVEKQLSFKQEKVSFDAIMFGNEDKLTKEEWIERYIQIFS